MREKFSLKIIFSMKKFFSQEEKYFQSYFSDWSKVGINA